MYAAHNRDRYLSEKILKEFFLEFLVFLAPSAKKQTASAKPLQTASAEPPQTASAEPSQTASGVDVGRPPIDTNRGKRKT